MDLVVHFKCLLVHLECSRSYQMQCLQDNQNLHHYALMENRGDMVVVVKHLMLMFLMAFLVLILCLPVEPMTNVTIIYWKLRSIVIINWELILQLLVIKLFLEKAVLKALLLNAIILEPLIKLL